MVGTFMIVLDFFIVNVALPSIQVGLHASTSQVEWVVAGYGLTLAVFLIAAGRLGDRIGRRRTFALGLWLFVGTSALCGLAPNASTLVAARLGQGIGAALISPNVLSIMGVVYPGEKRVKAITIYGMVMGLAAASGQVIGGVLIAANIAGSGWRAIFLINVPLGLAALTLLKRAVPESRAEQASRIDFTGMALITASLFTLVLPLVEGHDAGWPLWTWASLAASAALFAAFALSQRRLAARGGTPLLDPVVFRSPHLRSGLATQVAFWCGQASFYLVLSLYLQDGRGLHPLAAGAMFTILAAAYLATSMRAPALTQRFGRRLVFIGALFVALGDIALYVFVNHFGSTGPLALMAPGLVLVGAGQGLCITPLTTTVMSHCTPRQAGAISGALSTMQQVGNALGVAITGAVFYGSLHQGVPTAFERSLFELVILLAGVALLTRLLPGRRDLAAGLGD
jgi:EmrB/QacA subfamily drug resistance transporter